LAASRKTQVNKRGLAKKENKKKKKKKKEKRRNTY
jgi:hypothetical protein